MPVTLTRWSRRETLGFLAGVVVVGIARADETPADPHRFALFSDSHIPAQRETELRGVNMTAQLEQAVADALARPARPAAAFLSGDCAMLDGQPGDYANLAATMRPLLDANVPIHFALGNHDDRDNFRAGAAGSERSLMEEKQVLVVEAERANWFVLDSLDLVNKTPGKLGEKQQEWLAAELDRRADKPALIVVHHNPGLREEMVKGLIDSLGFFRVLAPRKHVKAIFYGHTHHWNVTKYEDIHLVNLPPTAYVFTEGKPSGWVEIALEEAGAKLTLRSLDPKHADHDRVTELAWRT